MPLPLVSDCTFPVEEKKSSISWIRMNSKCRCPRSGRWGWEGRKGGQSEAKKGGCGQQGKPTLSGQCMNSPRATPAPETHTYLVKGQLLNESGKSSQAEFLGEGRVRGISDPAERTFRNMEALAGVSGQPLSHLAAASLPAPQTLDSEEQPQRRGSPVLAFPPSPTPALSTDCNVASLPTQARDCALNSPWKRKSYIPQYNIH